MAAVHIFDIVNPATKPLGIYAPMQTAIDSPASAILEESPHTRLGICPRSPFHASCL